MFEDAGDSRPAGLGSPSTMRSKPEGASKAGGAKNAAFRCGKTNVSCVCAKLSQRHGVVVPFEREGGEASACRGVALVPRSGRWRTTFKHKSHRYCLGTFSTAEEAARVWDLAAIKSRARDFTGLNFPRESYAYEMELLDKYSLEQTLHMLKVKLVDAKRSGRAVKRKLDSALEEEKACSLTAEQSPAGIPIQPHHVLCHSPERKGTLSVSPEVLKKPGSNPFCKPVLVARRTVGTTSDSCAPSQQSGALGKPASEENNTAPRTRCVGSSRLGRDRPARDPSWRGSVGALEIAHPWLCRLPALTRVAAFQQ